MKFSTFSGTALIPTLARVVLCGAFITAGWNKCFKTADFDEAKALRLQALGVTVWRPPTQPTVRANDVPGFQLASFRQDEDPAQDDPDAGAPPPEDPAPTDPAPPPAEDLDAAPSTSPPVVTPGSGAMYRARAVHGVTWMVDSRGLPYPVVLGWAAGLTELFGGALLVVGLFSRIWGLGLAITMGVAFYMTSMEPLMDGRVLALASGEGIPAFNAMFCQLGLLVLSLCILFTGPGPLSLDHRIFRRARRGTIEYDTDDDSEPSSLRPF
ncbi:MAG: DoxX family protein [Planctomycetota bacterium]|jgi:uncharacterized membrane protein YphA (DoxX/SURF4 family)